MIDISSLTKNHVAPNSKKIATGKRVKNRDTSISKELPSTRLSTKSERRKKHRRKHAARVMLDLRSGRGRRADDHSGRAHIDISI